jgi:hypothetical protein
MCFLAQSIDVKGQLFTLIVGNICPQFWRQSKYTQGATLFHEMTHEYAGTEDYGYVAGTGNPPTYEIKRRRDGGQWL